MTAKRRKHIGVSECGLVWIACLVAKMTPDANIGLMWCIQMVLESDSTLQVVDSSHDSIIASYCYQSPENENIWEAKFLTPSWLSSKLADPRKLHPANNTETTTTHEHRLKPEKHKGVTKIAGCRITRSTRALDVRSVLSKHVRTFPHLQHQERPQIGSPAIVAL